MATVEVDVPEGYKLFPYFVKNEDANLAVDCFASTVKVVYEKDENGNDTEVELYTPAQRAKQRITKMLNTRIAKFQRGLVQSTALDAAVIKTNVVT